MQDNEDKEPKNDEVQSKRELKKSHDRGNTVSGAHPVSYSRDMGVLSLG